MAGTLQNPTISQLPGAGGQGQLAPLMATGGQTLLKYPDDVASANVPHYIIFNIYLPQTDPYITKGTVSTTATQSASQQNSDYSGSPGNITRLSKTGVAAVATWKGVQTAYQQFVSDSGSVGTAVVSGATSAVVSGALAGAVAAAGNDLISFRPKIKQISNTIAVFMPDTVMTTLWHDYNAISATDALGVLGQTSAMGASLLKSGPGSLGQMTSDLLHGKWKQAVGQIPHLGTGGIEAAGALSQMTGLVGPGFTDLALKSAGYAINPQVELIYQGTQNRKYVFEFHFQPRSASETMTIYNIIKTFKMYSSPDVNQSGLGRYFVVPGQFDITFKFGNIQNEFISKITTCSLTGMDIDYAGAGQWASMVDGSPADVKLQLRFTEGQIITRSAIAKNNF